MSICPKSMWPAVKAMLHSVYDQPDTAAVRAQFDRLLEYVSGKLPAVAEHLAEARADILAFTTFPKDVWSQVWSNNPSERLNKPDPPPHRRRRHLPEPRRDRAPRRRCPGRADRRMGRRPPLPRPRNPRPLPPHPGHRHHNGGEHRPSPRTQRLTQRRITDRYTTPGDLTSDLIANAFKGSFHRMAHRALPRPDPPNAPSWAVAWDRGTRAISAAPHQVPMGGRARSKRLGCQHAGGHRRTGRMPPTVLCFLGRRPAHGPLPLPMTYSGARRTACAEIPRLHAAERVSTEAGALHGFARSLVGARTLHRKRRSVLSIQTRDLAKLVQIALDDSVDVLGRKLRRREYTFYR